MRVDLRAGGWVAQARDGATDRRMVKPTVLVYRNELLPRSETFIKEQVLAYRRWRGVLIGRRRLSALPLHGLDVRLLSPVASSPISRLWWKVSRTMGAIPAPVAALLKREAPALIHAHFGPDAVQAAEIARALDIPMVATLHGYDINIRREWWEEGHRGEWFRHYPARLLELAQRPRTHFVAVSEAVRRRAIEFGIAPEKITVRYIGVDVMRFAPTRPPAGGEERCVLFVGRLVEKKGCEILIRAFADVQKAAPDVALIIVGDGELRKELESLANRLEVRARFCGALTNDEVRRALQVATVYCQPSVTAGNGDAEGLPITLLEAQASGVPVVTSAHSGSVEAIREGETGFSFPERNHQSLATRLVTILANPPLRDSMAKAAHLHAMRSFDIRECTARLEGLYDSFAQGEF
jgi:glycosyltransferase involved in cell wall biosynthesis